MKVHPQQLSRDALDWAVAACTQDDPPQYDGLTDEDRFSTVWAHGGPIVEDQRIGIFPGIDRLDPDHPRYWMGVCGGYNAMGDTALVAAMRAFVLCMTEGEEIDVPDELV